MAVSIQNKGNFLEIDDGVALRYIKKASILSFTVQQINNNQVDTQHGFNSLRTDQEDGEYELSFTTSELSGTSGPANRNEIAWYSESKSYHLGSFRSKQEAKAVLDKIMDYIN